MSDEITQEKDQKSKENEEMAHSSEFEIMSDLEEIPLLSFDEELMDDFDQSLLQSEEAIIDYVEEEESIDEDIMGEIKDSHDMIDDKKKYKDHDLLESDNSTDDLLEEIEEEINYELEASTEDEITDVEKEILQEEEIFHDPITETPANEYKHEETDDSSYNDEPVVEILEISLADDDEISDDEVFSNFEVKADGNGSQTIELKKEAIDDSLELFEEDNNTNNEVKDLDDANADSEEENNIELNETIIEEPEDKIEQIKGDEEKELEIDEFETDEEEIKLDVPELDLPEAVNEVTEENDVVIIVEDKAEEKIPENSEELLELSLLDNDDSMLMGEDEIKVDDESVNYDISEPIVSSHEDVLIESLDDDEIEDLDDQVSHVDELLPVDEIIDEDDDLDDAWEEIEVADLDMPLELEEDENIEDEVEVPELPGESEKVVESQNEIIEIVDEEEEITIEEVSNEDLVNNTETVEAEASNTADIVEDVPVQNTVIEDQEQKADTIVDEGLEDDNILLGTISLSEEELLEQSEKGSADAFFESKQESQKEEEILCIDEFRNDSEDEPVIEVFDTSVEDKEDKQEKEVNPAAESIESANLESVNLESVNLESVNLESVNLESVNIDENNEIDETVEVEEDKTIVEEIKEELETIDGPVMVNSTKEEKEGELNQQQTEEIKEVLKYIDTLFGDLPTEKIKEFAKSKYYDLYNKIFDELGI